MDLTNKSPHEIREFYFKQFPAKNSIPHVFSVNDIREDYVGWVYNGNFSSIEHIVNRKTHREDGPASTTGRIFYWYQNNLLHRLDGPARIDPYHPEYDEYYINDEKYTRQEFWEHPLVLEYKLNKIILL